MLSVLAFTAALINRELIYDDVLSITWLANANLAGTETFGLTRSSNENPTLDVNVITRWRKMHRW